MSKEEPFFVMPSKLLRVDNEICCLGAKVLLCVIHSLSRQKGYCYATNAYLCKTLNISERSLSRYIKQLVKAKFIYLDKNPKDERYRAIYVASLNAGFQPSQAEQIRIKANNGRMKKLSSDLLMKSFMQG